MQIYFYFFKFISILRALSLLYVYSYYQFIKGFDYGLKFKYRLSLAISGVILFLYQIYLWAGRGGICCDKFCARHCGHYLCSHFPSPLCTTFIAQSIHASLLDRAPLPSSGADKWIFSQELFTSGSKHQNWCTSSLVITLMKKPVSHLNFQNGRHC